MGGCGDKDFLLQNPAKSIPVFPNGNSAMYEANRVASFPLINKQRANVYNQNYYYVHNKNVCPFGNNQGFTESVRM